MTLFSGKHMMMQGSKDHEIHACMKMRDLLTLVLYDKLPVTGTAIKSVGLRGS